MFSRERRLYRSVEDKKIGGVAAGFAEYFGVSVVLTRIVLVALLFAGFGFPLYILFWILTPRDPDDGFADTGRSPSRLPLYAATVGAVVIGLILVNEIVGTDFATVAFVIGLAVGFFLFFRGRRIDDEDVSATFGREYARGFSITTDLDDGTSVRVIDVDTGIDRGRIAGICARIGAALGVDPTIVRVVTVILIPVTFPIVPILYAVAALVMPKSSGRVSG